MNTSGPSATTPSQLPWSHSQSKFLRHQFHNVAMCFASNNVISKPGMPISSLHKSLSLAFRLAGNSQIHFVVIDFLVFRHWQGVQGRRSSFGFTVNFQSITRTKKPQNEFRCIHVGRNNVVGRATRNGLDGPGIESRLGKRFFRSRPQQP
jgi:hypothetical protein